MRLIDYLATASAFYGGVNAAFGLLSTSAKYTVDTDGGLVFEVNRHVYQSNEAS